MHRRMPLLCRDLDHRLPLKSAQRHARQILDTWVHQIGFQGRSPGRGAGVAAHPAARRAGEW